MDVNVNVRVPGLEKLLDYAVSGIGSVAGPMLASWRARREVEAKRIASEGQAAELQILAEGQSSALQTIANAQAAARGKLGSQTITTQGELTIGEAVSQRIQFQEEKRQSNIGAVIRLAAPEMEDKDVPDHEPDHDWTARFFNEIQDVSSEEMQLLWAKVLAGEVERPGSTSIRTLSILRNLDQATAALLKQFCSACVSLKLDGDPGIDDSRVLSLGGQAGGNALLKYGFPFGALNVLNEHGLIISDYHSWRDYMVSIGVLSSQPTPVRMRVPFSFQGRYWTLSSTTKRALNKELKLHGVALTRSGRELSGIVDLLPMNEYAQALMKFLQENNLTMTEVSDASPQTF